MNDNTDAIDEPVSRYLDAEVTDDEAALVERAVIVQRDEELLVREGVLRDLFHARLRFRHLVCLVVLAQLGQVSFQVAPVRSSAVSFERLL